MAGRQASLYFLAIAPVVLLSALRVCVPLPDLGLALLGCALQPWGELRLFAFFLSLGEADVGTLVVAMAEGLSLSLGPPAQRNTEQLPTRRIRQEWSSCIVGPSQGALPLKEQVGWKDSWGRQSGLFSIKCQQHLGSLFLPQPGGSKRRYYCSGRGSGAFRCLLELHTRET